MKGTIRTNATFVFIGGYFLLAVTLFLLVSHVSILRHSVDELEDQIQAKDQELERSLQQHLIAFDELPACRQEFVDSSAKVGLESACPRIDQKLVIVIPCEDTEESINTLAKNLASWSEFFPCDLERTKKNTPDLVIDSKKGDGSLLRRLDARVRECFGTITETKADSGISSLSGRLSHFIKGLSSKEYSLMFFMSPSTFPIRKGWLDGLRRESLCGDDFWIKGCPGSTQAVDKNAIYNIGDQSFRDFAESLSDSTEPIDTHIFNRIYPSQHAVFAKNIMHKYIYSDFIQYSVGKDLSQEAERLRDTPTLLVTV